MRILHTADWHLGKRLDTFSRMEEQTKVLSEIIEICDLLEVDLVLIAGDVFDTFNPPVEATELFYSTLKKLSNNGKRPIIAIAGNHDSPDRIDAPDALARECGIFLIGHPKAEVRPLELSDFKISKSAPGFLEIEFKNHDFPIRIIHSAYANEVRLKQSFGEDKETGLNETLKEHWADLANEYCDENGVNLLMTHLYMNKRGSSLLEEPEGEKPLKIGNADLVYSDAIPSQIDYSALGHLHAYNNIGSAEKPVVYSSSLLAYSFSEAGQTKYVSIVDFELNSPVKMEKVALKSGRQLFRKTFTAIDEAVTWLSANPYCLVELTIESDEFIKAEERRAIFQAHDGIIHLIPKVKKATIDISEVDELGLKKDLNELFIEYFKSKHANQEPNEDLINLLNEIKTAE